MSRYSIDGQILTDIADAIRNQIDSLELETIQVKSAPGITGYKENTKSFEGDITTDNIYQDASDEWVYLVYELPENADAVRITGYFDMRDYGGKGFVAEGEQKTETPENILFNQDTVVDPNWVDATTTARKITIGCMNTSIPGHFLLDFTYLKTKFTPGEMAPLIDSMTTLHSSLLEITGSSLSYKFYNGGWDSFVERYGDKMITKDITHCPNAFYGSDLTKIPFVINFKNDTSTCDGNSMFENADKLQEVPVMKGNWRPSNLHNMFKNCKNLREFPEGFGEDWDWSKHTTQTSGYSGNKADMFINCYSLRKLPMGLFKYGNPVLNYSYHPLRNMTNLYALDEIVDMPYPHTVACKGTGYSSFFYEPFENFHRLKTFTFAPDIGVKEWANQVLDFTWDVGYAPQNNDYTKFTDYNSGVDIHAEIKDDASYQLYKDNPDAWVSTQKYSRYNHDSAVATINSLPDCSVYAAANGSNIIKFEGASGELTDGGAINTLTDEEIAVATAKGWTVTLV